MAVKGFGVLWVDNNERKPEQFDWYLVAIEGDEEILPVVGIALFDTTRRAWDRICYPYLNNLKVTPRKIRYWARQVELPPELKKIKDAERPVRSDPWPD